MGQKSNLVTLRKHQNISLFKNDPKLGIIVTILLKNITFLLKKKFIIMDKSHIKFCGNSVELFLVLFYSTRKVSNIKRKLKKQISTYKYKKYKIFELFLKKILSLYRLNDIYIKVKNINNTINKNICGYFYTKLKRFSTLLFAKRFNFFIDLIKICALLYEDKITSKTFLMTIGKVFSFLHKTKHTPFIIMLTSIINDEIRNIKLKKPIIKGMKFYVSGRLLGKTRASTQKIVVGNIPTQSLNKKIDFEKLNVFTPYGVFGFQLWLSKTN